jgi:hypothetical protein
MNPYAALEEEDEKQKKAKVPVAKTTVDTDNPYGALDE